MNVEANIAPEADVLVLNAAANSAFEARDPKLGLYSERHFCDLVGHKTPGSDGGLSAKLQDYKGDRIVVSVAQGLPSRKDLGLARAQVGLGRRVYFFWPAEKAIEVVDRHRLASYRRHWLFFVGTSLPLRVFRFGKGQALRGHRLMNGALDVAHIWKVHDLITKLDEKRITLAKESSADAATAKLRASAHALLGTASAANPTLPSRANKIHGAGAYVRLDYWSKLKAGGSYGHTCFLANSAAAATQDFECIFANKFELLDRLGVRQRLLKHSYPSRTSTDLMYYGAKFRHPLHARLDELKPRYVYERSVLGSCAAAEWCQKAGVPYIVEYNGSELAMARSFGRPYDLEGELEKMEDYQFSVATVINVISEPVAESLKARGIAREKILVNPNSVDPEFYKRLATPDFEKQRAAYKLSQGDIVVGFSGTFGGWHGIDVLAASMPPICKSNPKAKFLLIGDGNLKSVVKNAVADAGIQRQVVDLGLIPQAEGARAMAVCDILVAPHAQNIDGKTFFGSPTKLFEYMAVGAAVVASDLAQLGEVMRPSLSLADLAHNTPVTTQRGVLVAPGSVEDFVAAVTGLIGRPDVRAALSNNARKAVIENYTWDNHVQNIWRFMAGETLKGYATDRLKPA
jgi:glycosyltransferase involved in cell wall biosynthesis